MQREEIFRGIKMVLHKLHVMVWKKNNLKWAFITIMNSWTEPPTVRVCVLQAQ